MKKLLSNFAIQLMFIPLLTACSGGGSAAIDQLFGGASSIPILTSIQDQVVSQGDLLKVDVNNIQNGQPGTDEDMSYTCTFDRSLDSAVTSGQACTTLPGSNAQFQASTGVLTWTPDSPVLGGFEFKITGTDKKGHTYDEIFSVSVRLKFNGIGLYSQITGTSVNVNWTPNPDAQSYQVFKLNPLSGQYETFRTVSGGSQSGVTLTGLSPNTGYTLRVQAVDVLGNLDGNVVSRSFTTTELVKFAMSPATATLSAGTPTTVTVTAFNANGTPQTVGGVTLTPQIQSGTSSGSFGPVTDHNNGTYTFTFTPTIVGTPLALEVTTNMSFFLQNTVAVTVVPGPASSANSSVTASAGSVVSGQSVGITATVRDAYNNPITDDSLISLVKSGGSSTGNFAPITHQGNGVYSSSYTGITAGTAQTIRVAVSGTPLTPTATVQVLPGAPVSAHSTLTISSATVQSGSSVNLIATLKDLNQNPVPTGVLVSFNKSGGTSTGTFDSVVNAGNGEYTTTYTGIASGTAQTLSVSVDGITLSATVTIQVLPGAPSLANSSLSTSATSISSGNFATLTATLRDANNNPIASSSTVTFTKTGGTSTGTFGVLNDQGGGVYTIRYNGVTAGTAQTIGVSINGTNLGLASSITVVPGLPSASQSTISSTAGSVVSGQSVTVTATLRDANNNLIPTGLLVGFSKTGGTSTGSYSSVTNVGNGSYTATYTGLNAGTAQSLGILVDGIELGPNTPVAVVPGAIHLPNSSLSIGSASIVSGTNTIVTATLRDENNNPISASNVVTFSKTGGTSTGNFGTVTNQGSGVYTVSYTGIAAGTDQTIRVLSNAVDVGFTVNVAVLAAAPSITKSTISVSSGTVQSGSDVTVTATLKDLNDNLISSGYLVGFSKTGGSSTGNFGSITNAGNGVYTTTYSAITAGSAQTLGILIDGTNLGPTTSITVLPGDPSNLLSTFIVSSASIIAGQTSTLTATIRDANSNPISSGILVSFDKVGGTSVGSIGSVTNQGNGVYTAVYTGTGAGTANTLQTNVNAMGLGPSRTVQVLVGAPTAATSTLTITSSPVASGNIATISAVIKDAYNNPITTEYAITFDASGGSSTGDFGSISTGPVGTFSTTYTAVLAGSAQTIRVLSDGVAISGLTKPLQVVPGAVYPPNSLFSIASSTVQSGTSTNLSMNLRDANNNAISSGLTLTFSKTAGVSDGTIGAVTNTGSGNYSATYTGTTQGPAQTITLVVNGTAQPALAVSATVTAGPPTQLALTGPANPLNTTDCAGPYTVTLKDASGNTTSSLTGTNITLSSAPAGSHLNLIFSDSSCTTEAPSLSTAPLVSSTSFYYKSYVPQTFSLVLTPDGGIASKSVTIQNIPVLSWIGSAILASTMNGSGTGFMMDDRAGGFITPQGAVVRNNMLYAIDSAAGRILKFDLLTQEFKGWLGHIGSEDNLNAGCGTTSLGSFTQSWCLGGRSDPSTTTILQAPRAITADSNYLYVAGGNRIARFRLPAGTYEGWIGKVGGTLPPTSSQLTTCVGATTNAKTPGWCLGGSTTNGSLDGEFDTIAGVTFLNGKLYAADYANHRLQKFDAGTGAFEGWVGLINAAPTSPGACVGGGIGTNTTTPTWCSGGTAKASSRYNLAITPSEVAAPQEGFYNPIGVDNDGTYLYVSDYNNRRVVRVNAVTGSFEGWIGRVRRSTGLSPTTPAQTAGGFSSTWIQGGTTNEVADSTGLCGVNAAHPDGPFLYISDNCHRVVRVNLADGQDFKWIGRAATSPTGGFPGCSSTPVSGATPGWCLNGSSDRVGLGNSMFVNPISVETDANYLYVVDRDNYRLQKFDKNTGEFVSWIGAQRATAPTWRRTPTPLYARGGYDDYSSSDMVSAWAGVSFFGDNMFVSDPGVHRIKRFSKRTGEMIGYIGTLNGMAYQPVAPDNCVGATTGMTPDWCRGGGRTTNGTGIHGYSSPYAVAADGTYVYIASNGNYRIDRVRISDALYMGWIGRISTVPTDGDPSCLSSNTNDATPTWCIGGTAKTGSGSGHFPSARGITYDPSNQKLYVVNIASLIKIDAVTGVTEGTVGHMSAGSGCSITSSVAGTWCTNVTVGGGTHSYGGIYYGTGITFDNDYLYVTTTGNHRILRFNKATGAPAGFIGQLANGTNINVTATGGACSGMTNDPVFPKPAPGWCWTTNLGSGVSLATPSNVEGAFDSPRGIFAYGGYLYVADSGNNRIVRINAATGAFDGWKGYIMSTADMSDPDCIAAGTGPSKVTPKWCKGGVPGPSQRLGGFDLPTGITGDEHYLYVHDGYNNRLVTVPRE